MKKYISTSAGIIIIFVVAIIAFSGIFTYQYYSKISNFQLPISNKSSNVQNSNTETAGWKTYTNASHSMSFKYPSNFVIESSDGKNVNLKLISGYNIEFSIIDNLPKKDESGRTIDSGKVLSETVLINGNRFIKNYYLFYGGMGGWDGYIWNYVDRGDGNLYKFSIPFFDCFGVPGTNGNNSPSKQEIIDKCLSYQKNNEGNDPMKTMNQILSTFKFTK